MKTLALIAALALFAAAAKADSMDQFTFYFIDTLSFDLPAQFQPTPGIGDTQFSVLGAFDGVPQNLSILLGPTGFFNVASDSLDQWWISASSPFLADDNFIPGTYSMLATEPQGSDATLTITPVSTPEPSTGVLLLFALACMALIQWTPIGKRLFV